MGIGLAVAASWSRRGAQVVIAGRDGDALDAALAQLPGQATGAAPRCLGRRRLGAGDGATGRRRPLHGLVTAAGVLGPIGPLDAVPMDEFAETISINLVGTALALHHALPRLRAVSGRAVTFSGGGGTSPLPRYDAYATAKAGVVRLTENVAAGRDIELNCVAPGFVATRMHEGTLRAGPQGAGADYHRRTEEQLAQGGFPASEAAELVAFLLGDGARGITGRLLSAQWDPWRDQGFQARLRSDPDLATLRRIDDQFFAASNRPDS